jgi:fatty-acyl-CoA synthase
MEVAADRGEEIVFLDGPTPAPVPRGAFHEDALRMAVVLQGMGLQPGDRAGLLGATSRGILTALVACWLAGATVIVPPLRTRMEDEGEFRSRTVERLRLGDVSLNVCDDDLRSVVGSAEDLPPPISLSELWGASQQASVGGYEVPSEDRERITILQFTSGSTSDPKGVMIPEVCLLDNIDAVLDRAPLAVGDDVIVSWLPLYHDMGLVYNAALAITTGVRFVLAPPSRFIASPASWMEWMDAFGGTWTIGPNFSLSLARRLLGRSNRLDLRRCTRLGSGSEPVDPRVMEAFGEAATPHGLDVGALYAGYGMAEATVAVSFVAPGSGFKADSVNGSVLEHDGVAEPCAADHPDAKQLARCGPPLRGMEVRITDPESGEAVGERVAGEIELRGPSVVPGYFRRPEATAAAFRDGGWLCSGDLGYLAEGELVVCGRLKDVIIVGGRNLFPEELERPVQDVEGVRAGNVIAFGVDGGRKGDSIVLVAEVKDGRPDKVREAIFRAVSHAVGVRPDDVVLVHPGSLPKTSSGKLRRSACRSRYQASSLEQV